MLRLCVLLSFCLSTVAVGNSEGYKLNDNYLKPKIESTSYDGTVAKLSKDSIRLEIINVLRNSGYTVRMQEIILAQAIHESGNFTNRLSKKWNNVFSIYKSRYDTLAIGNHGIAEGRKGWAVYRNVQDATKAYILYTSKREYPKDTTLSAYVAFMKRKGYFTADEKQYYNCMKTIISRNEK